ncbi:helix-turn-helix domain-containing protein [Xenorhabdus khoisanae]|uniref:helix-turn-helix domain-containing protein n=1 Tax=Xenorhabdus khoisanae TaxID=880157 RepID=UPI0009081416|nr:helix-turn-helix transcriptional regulator [Xenorhabdus khoisanae]
MIDEIDVKIGNRIRVKRKEIRLSAQILAERIGTSQQQLSRYERGTNKIGAAHLVQIAIQLGTPIGWFFLDVYKHKINNPLKLSLSQAKFAAIVSDYPNIAEFWNWHKREIDLDLWSRKKDSLSVSEKTLAKFFIFVWTSKNSCNFDVSDAAVFLGKQERQLIANWILEPFWPSSGP